MKQPTVLFLFLFGLSFSYAQKAPGQFSSAVLAGAPALEIIQARQEKTLGTPPLLFIHGYRMGAWVFEDTYLPFFHDRGYEVFAVNLRGHGRSEGAEDIEGAVLEDYYADLERAVAYVERETGARPVLIGFSMGAVLIQRFLAEYELEAAVMVGMGDVGAALPHYLEWRRRRFSTPLETEEDRAGIDDLYGKPDFHRALFFMEEERPEGHKKYITKMATQPGSKKIWADLADFTPPEFNGETAVLILAGDQDPLTPATALEQARNFYHAEVVVLENTRHGIPVGENWKKGAKSILRFLRQTPADGDKEISLLGAQH